MWIVFIAACALNAQRVGMLEAADGKMTITEPEGRTAHLTLTGGATLLRECEGCQVAISGPRWGRRIVVRDWEVRDSGDGTTPYVGLLRRYGGNWLVDDMNTQREVILDAEALGALAGHEGEVVVISGYIVGAQTVHVVSWRSLGLAPTAP